MKISISYLGRIYQVEANFSHHKSGQGQWNIVATVEFMDEEKNFPFHFTNSSFIDDVTDIISEEGFSDLKVQEMYYSQIASDFNEIVGEWCEELQSFLD